MKVPIGRDLFEIKLVDGPIVIDGKHYASRVINEKCEIHVLRSLSEEERLQVLGIAINRAWTQRTVPLVFPRWHP